MNKNTIDIINKEVSEGFRYFYFDKESHNLVASNRGNMGSLPYNYPDSIIELCITKETTLDYVVARLEFYMD